MKHVPKFALWKEFKEFAMRGNVVDLAVGVIIGAAFGKIIDSLVKDIVMPPIGMLMRHVDFADLYWNLSGGEYETLEEAREAGAVTMNYGMFLNNVISFLVVALVVFLLIRQINRLTKPSKKEMPTTRECPYCRSIVKKTATRCAFCTSEIVAAT